MSRRLLLVAVLACLVAPMVAGAPLERLEVSTDELLDLATRVVIAENEYLAAGTRAPFMVWSSEVAIAAEQQKELLDARRDALAAHGLGYSNPRTTITLINISRSVRTTRVRVREHTTFNIESSDLGAPPETIVTREHDIDCVRTKKGWVAVAHSIRDDDHFATPAGVLTEPPVVLPDLVIDDAAMYGDTASDERTVTLRLETQARKYDRGAVAGYARRWVGEINTSSTRGYNPAYIAYAENDCTNFVSQAIASGGFPHVKGFYWTAGAWWYDKWAWPRVHSDAWTIANTMKQFLGRSSRVRLLSTIRDLQVGDVLQADWEDDGWVDHTTVVTGRDGKGNIWLTYHSTNKMDVSFWDFDAQAKRRNAKVKYFRWHLADSF